MLGYILVGVICFLAAAVLEAWIMWLIFGRRPK